MRATGIAGTVVAALALAACGGDPSEAVAKAKPADAAALETYSRNISETVDLAANPDLVQRFCKNGLGAACPEDITAKLTEYGYSKSGTGVDLAHAFVLMVADQKDGEVDFSASDEDYLFAAYRVALGRDPDEGGARDNLIFIQDTGSRKTMLRSLLESAEFRGQG
jgi:hypothetical protein